MALRLVFLKSFSMSSMARLKACLVGIPPLVSISLQSLPECQLKDKSSTETKTCLVLLC